MKKSAILLLALAFAVAGCTETGSSDEPASTSTASNAKISVTEAVIESGYCFEDGYGTGEAWCHLMTVDIDNTRGKEDVDTSGFSWDAVTANGQVFDAYFNDGATGIAPGFSGMATIGIEVETEGVEFTTLRYHDFVNDPTEHHVPKATVKESPISPVVLEVTDAVEESGQCWDPEFGQGEAWCHTLTVEIDNREGTEDFDTSWLNWFGVAEGGVYDAEDALGPEAIAAGATGTIEVQFEFDEGGFLLTTLRYDDELGTQLEAEVPDY